MITFHNNNLNSAHITIMDWVHNNVQFDSVRWQFYDNYMKAMEFLYNYEHELREFQEEVANETTSKKI